MTITYPIGYPTPDPMHNPKGYPNRGRIARPVSYRPVSSPSIPWQLLTTSSSSVPASDRDGVVTR